jgi:hypothetical protein
MGGINREKELNLRLEELKQLHATVSPLLVGRLTTEGLPAADEAKTATVTAIHLLLLNAARIDSLLKAATLDGTQTVNPQLLQFYREQFVPHRVALQSLFLDLIGLPNVKVDLRKVHPRTELAPIWNILVSGLDYWRLDEDNLLLKSSMQQTSFFTRGSSHPTNGC